MSTEYELKFSAGEKTLQELAQRYGEKGEVIRMETAYYDTPDGGLSGRKYTLRTRLENGVSICTLKTPGEQGARGEWELPCEKIEDAIDGLCALGAPECLRELVKGGLVQVCGAKFTRIAVQIFWEGAQLELALDRGVLLGGGREQPLFEVEVELKSGSREAAWHFADHLSQQHCLQQEQHSKFRRALNLAKGE